MRFDANLSMLFADRPLVERPAAAARAGFRAVESWWPFAGPTPPGAEVDAFVASLAAAGVSLVALNLDGGDFDAGERGLLALPEARSRFRDGLEVALEVASRTGCRLLNALYGQMPDPASATTAWDTAVANLALASDLYDEAGTIFMVEALNETDFPVYGLHSYAQASALVNEATAAGARAGLQLDLYHVHMAGEDPAAAIVAYRDQTRHVQIADAPDRITPGQGRIAWAPIWKALDDTGYAGWVGLEHRPGAAPDETFGWLTTAGTVHVPTRMGAIA